MIAIVTDSTAYLTHEEAVELGVVIVPMSYSFGKDMSLNEGCIENDEHAERQVAEGIDHVHTPRRRRFRAFSTPSSACAAPAMRCCASPSPRA